MRERTAAIAVAHRPDARNVGTQLVFHLDIPARVGDDTSLVDDLEARILAALKAPGRTEGVRKIAARFGVDPSTVQRISRPFDNAGAAA